MTERRRILVPIINPAPFISEDVATLRTQFDVTEMPCTTPGEMLRCALAMREFDELFCWFGSLRFVPVVLAARGSGKRVTIVTGGYDVASEPEIGYGNMQSEGWHVIPRTLGRTLFAAADRVITYSEAASREATANALVDPSKLRMIYLGVDVTGCGERRPKERLVLNVSGIDASTIHRKGLLTVARASRLAPDVAFIIAGKHIDPAAVQRLRDEGGANLALPGFVSDDELLALYQRAKVFVMPSLHEAFGCSVAEAMLQRCIPVVSRRGSLPELAGDTGHYVDPGDAEATAAAIRQALTGPPHGSDEARERIRLMFDVRQRREALLQLMA